ncbi:MAG: hypothetical protein GWN21_09575 [Gammaproteobacteria bacterium]|nr:hypothetical protein [Gammaproteobacteria bacterium]NIP88904.1 hypothetical protein [Gammaproteobacteria bacterium]NIR23825.1 hypothetical protein [Gammaproteobacteria bacterium]NIS05274.1 hypothetical protein [Gammaproteobacteria bacterium]NIU42689.1 hypothetical protein [Gammaproteobacteria bacterium]
MSLIHGILTKRACFGFGLTLLLIAAQPTSATHLIDHRYTVWGEVKYPDGSPAADLTVRLLIKDGAPLGQVATDGQGRYRILLHVHNEDLYKVFDMKVNEVTRKVRILFNPSDAETERGQRIDLVVKHEDQPGTSSTQSQ